MSTPSQRATASRAKGARFERVVAAALRLWWPQARRSRDNGSVVTDDTGDIDGTHPDLWWSLKDHRNGVSSPPGLITAWLTEAAAKSRGRIPLLVQKRAGHADPTMSWCWLWIDDLARLLDGPELLDEVPAPYARLELRTVLALLAARGYAPAPDRS